MAKVSVLIPSRNERFVVPTVKDLLSKAAGDIEVIVVLDGGNWPDPPLPDDPRLHVLRFNESRGMRPAINAAVQIATGEYLLKCDGHTAWEPGYDRVLVEDYHEDNWILVPRRDRLDPIGWCKQETGKPPIDAHYLSFPFERPDDPSCGLHGTIWPQRARARLDRLLDRDMSSQGSAWFMSRRHWDRLGPMDVINYGSFIQEMQELGLKTQLSGGEIMVTKRTTYLHLHKGKTYGRGYHLSSAEQRRGAEFATRFWMTDSWTHATRTLRAVVESFNADGIPVPTWPRDLDRAFSDARRRLAA